MLDLLTWSYAAWGPDGRDDGAAGVTVADPGGVDIELHRPVEMVALRWSRAMPAGVRVLGDHWERGYGDLEWHGCSPERVLPWYVLTLDQSTGSLWGAGVKTGAGSFASWRVDEGGVTLVLDVRCGGRAVTSLGRVVHACDIVQLESLPGESPFAFAHRLCGALCPSPRMPSSPVYGGNDWYHRYGNITASTVKVDAANIGALATSATNRPFFVIDAGWFGSRGCDGGPYTHGHDGFPDMPGLAGYIEGIGVKPGIWMRPLLTTDDVPQSWRMPTDHPLANGKHVTLDPSVPETVHLVKQDIARLAGWGYKLIKHDFTTYDITGRWGFEMGNGITRGGWSFADTARTTAEIVRDFYAALREAAGDVMLIGCNTVGHRAAGLFELQRTGDDTSGRHWERTRKMGINTLAFRMPQHGAFFAADADCVGITGSVPWHLNSQWLQLLAHSGTPLFVSAHPDALGEPQRDALRAAFAIAAEPQAAMEPLDWLHTTCPHRYRQGTSTLAFNWLDYTGSALPCPG